MELDRTYLLSNKRNHWFKIKSIYYFPIIYLLLSPFADLITGIMILKMGMGEGFIGSPSQLIRIVFLISFFFLLNKRELLISIGVLLWLIAIESTAFFYIPSFSPFISGLNNSIKILFILLLYFATKQSLAHGISYSKLSNALLNSSMFYGLGILIPTFLGIGMTTYTEGTFGQRGLFASGNALGIYLGLTSFYALLRKNKTKYEKIQTIIIIAALSILGTKTALLCLGCAFIIFLSMQPKTIRLLFICLITGILILYYEKLIELFSTVFDVIIFLYDRKPTFFSFIMNSRDDYILGAFSDFFKSDIWFLKLCFGGGAFISFRPYYVDGMVFDQLETDIFDVFFMYGIIGAIAYLSCIGFFLTKAIKTKNMFLTLVTLFFSFHSILAGHIIFDGIPMIVGFKEIKEGINEKVRKRI